VGLARRGQLTAPRLEGALLSVQATTWKMLSSTRFPSNQEVVRIPDELAAFKYYAGAGVQYQPFETLKYAMTFVNVPVPNAIMAKAVGDRLLRLGVPRGNSLAFEYYFPFGGPPSPWVSSLSQAVAADFFSRLAVVLGAGSATDTGSAPYLDAALRASRSFAMSPIQGGVGVPQGAGRWYLIYPFAPAQRVLNAQLQSIVSLSLYNKAVPSPATQKLVDQGVAAVLPLLPKFDTGGWSRYQYNQEANLNYHDFMTDLFKKLSKDPAFAAVPEFETYYEKFAADRITPPSITEPAAAFPTLIPPTDGFKDDVKISYHVDKRSTDVVSILNADGALVRSLSTSGVNGTHTVTWNGATSSGVAVPAGDYTVQIGTRDILGNYHRGPLAHTITVVRDTDLPVLGSIVTRSTGAKSSTVTVKVSDASSGYVTASLELGGIRLGSVKVLRGKPGVLKVAFSAAQVKRATLKLTDSSGNVTSVPPS
jgi:hypothetical protein